MIVETYERLPDRTEKVLRGSAEPLIAKTFYKTVFKNS